MFAGFSDPTVLNNALLGAAGLASLHGTSGYFFFQPPIDEVTASGFWAMVSGPVAGREVVGQGWRVHRASGGPVSGPVVGGNLRAFGALAGTRWMPDVSGAIMLIEEMTATFEHVDTALTHLRLTGAFDGIAALMVGEPADWPAKDAPDSDVDELVLRCVGGDFPVVTNVPCGHRPDRILPIGCQIELDLTRSALRYLEDLVTPA